MSSLVFIKTVCVSVNLFLNTHLKLFLSHEIHVRRCKNRTLAVSLDQIRVFAMNQVKVNNAYYFKYDIAP